MDLTAIYPEDSMWTGRTDGRTPEHRRWHQVVDDRRPDAVTVDGRRPGGLALVGFASDEGVRRNHGRLGAVEGPDALRRALAPIAMHGDFRITDTGTVTVREHDLEEGQERLAEHLAPLWDRHELVVVLGGGHETAWGSYLGLTRSTRMSGQQRMGVLNLDAHFDLREADEPSSGTPFLQMARAEQDMDRELRYTVLGISEPSNTRVLFQTAARLGVEHLTDEECSPGELPRVLAMVDSLLDEIDVLHLSIDLDVLPAAVAPGVSAPAGYGVSLEVIHAICRHAARSGKLALVDVVELSPRFDVGQRTARTAARLITTLAHDALAPYSASSTDRSDNSTGELA